MQKFRRFRDYIFTQKHRDFLGCFWVKMPASPTRVTTINGAEMAVRLGQASQISPLPARYTTFRAIVHRKIQHDISAEAWAIVVVAKTS